MARKTAEQRWRERYSKASSRLRAQIRALEKRYPESVALEEGRRQDWGGLKTLPKDYSLKDLKRLTKYAEKTLKSGMYSLQRHRRAYANAKQTLQSDYGLDIEQKDIGSYFRFLDDIRRRGLASLLYNRAPSLFRQARKQGMSKADLKANIDRWSKEYEKAIASKTRYKPSLDTGSSSFVESVAKLVDKG